MPNPDDVKSYLSYLATARNVASSTQNQAFNALLLLYRNVYGIDLGDMGGTKYIDGVHEPLVSRWLFLRVQAIRADRRKNAAHAKRQPRPEFPLRGHVLCPECDRLLTASVSRGRTRQ